MVGTWVNTIALNAYRGILRRESNFDALPELSTKNGVDLAAIEVSRILGLCRPRDRALLEQQMRGHSNAEMAIMQGVTATAIRIRLLRARRAARMRLEGRGARRGQTVHVATLLKAAA
jgi:DNA-directed RNA polymerase specialized sigma24 family protein